MNSSLMRRQSRLKRQRRLRRKIVGTAQMPRLSVFRSSRHIYAQIIDDAAGRTLAAASTLDKDLASGLTGRKKAEKAEAVGKLIAERAIDCGIRRVIFDRNGFLYHGRVKAVSDGAREGGLDF
mgnify:CR=1 FL=1